MKKEKGVSRSKEIPPQIYAEVLPSHLIAATFLGGLFGLVTGIFYYAQVSILLIPFVPLTDLSLTFVFLAVIFAPFGEELMKASSVVFIESEEKLAFTPLGWMYLGVGSGLGFTLFENMLYGAQFVSQFGLRTAGMLLFLRFLLPLHLLTTGIASYGIGAWKKTGEEKYLIFLISAMVIHGIHNYLSFLLEV